MSLIWRNQTSQNKITKSQVHKAHTKRACVFKDIKLPKVNPRGRYGSKARVKVFWYSNNNNEQEEQTNYFNKKYTDLLNYNKDMSNEKSNTSKPIARVELKKDKNKEEKRFYIFHNNNNYGSCYAIMKHFLLTYTNERAKSIRLRNNETSWDH